MYKVRTADHDGCGRILRLLAPTTAGQKQAEQTEEAEDKRRWFRQRDRGRRPVDDVHVDHLIVVEIDDPVAIRVTRISELHEDRVRSDRGCAVIPGYMGPSVVSHADGILSRVARAWATLARMASAFAVHTKGFESWL